MNMRNEALKKLEWIEFNNIDEFLSSSKCITGVYILAFDTDVGPITLYTGSGHVKVRMRSTHSENNDIMEYKPDVYCASTSQDEMKGIEVYLASKLKPMFGKRWPNVKPIPVNLPDWFHDWRKND